jgi:hypothetical protein
MQTATSSAARVFARAAATAALVCLAAVSAGCSSSAKGPVGQRCRSRRCQLDSIDGDRIRTRDPDDSDEDGRLRWRCGLIDADRWRNKPQAANRQHCSAK